MYEWGKASGISTFMMGKIEKIRNNLLQFTKSYDLPGSHRTSNMIDRLMQRMDRYLFNTQYFHGRIESATRGIRAWALIQNFAPSNPETIQKYNGLQSPAEKLNGFCYHDNWLQNLSHDYSTIQLPTVKGAVINIRKAGIPEGIQLEIYKKLGIDIDKLPIKQNVA